MRKFSIVLLAASLFAVMSYAQAQDDPCAQFTNPKEKKVCNDMMPGLNTYRDDLVKKHAMPLTSVPKVPGADVESRYKTIKLPPAPGHEPDRGITIQQQNDDASTQSKHRNIFQ